MSADNKRLADRRILIVDDDPDILATMGAVMEAEGAEVERVDNGNAAVEACTEWRPDLVLLDMMLPKRSGFLVLERIKGRANSPLVIMITANEGKRHQTYARQLGADRYLQKPVPLELLVGTAHEMLEERDREEANLDLSDFEEDADDEDADDTEEGDEDDEE
jgi:DNA-binding response OmpR family regulator